ncbi:hypothetical protein AB0F77_33130 [Streptomyces sp. NPDC026672]|uniref:hypothetical protein n=1 Tax=unclassified Streptomyces TaxID=2593676 RepID=UPI0033D4B8B3
MDEISGLVMTVAAGAAGEVGRHLWETLVALVRRTPDEPAAVRATAEPELTALGEAPHDPDRASALSDALLLRAQQDPAFRTALTDWCRHARSFRSDDNSTHNTVGGGSQSAPILQGRDFSNITFGS